LEFVLADAPTLARVRPDPSPFYRQIAGRQVATFTNLGGDAVLVAPGRGGTFPHLAAFCRTAPATLQDLLWREVASAIESWPARRTLWVSTSGLGVHWLHVRLDSRPKYYTHAPYRP